MSRQNALAFFTQVEQNPTLKQKVQTAASKEELFSMAQEAGYSFTVDDMKAISETTVSNKLSDELNEKELEAVAGGGVKQIAGEVVDTAKDVWNAFWG